MPITIQRLPDEPILLVQFQNPLDLASEALHFADRLQAVLDASPVPLTAIADASAITFTVADMAAGLGLIARAELLLLHHPKVADYYVAVGDNLPALQAASPGSDAGPAVQVTRTLNQALNLIRNPILHRAQ